MTAFDTAQAEYDAMQPPRYDHGAVVAEQRAAFDVRTAEILRSAYALLP